MTTVDVERDDRNTFVVTFAFEGPIPPETDTILDRESPAEVDLGRFLAEPPIEHAGGTVAASEA